MHSELSPCSSLQPLQRLLAHNTYPTEKLAELHRTTTALRRDSVAADHSALVTTRSGTVRGIAFGVMLTLIAGCSGSGLTLPGLPGAGATSVEPGDDAKFPQRRESPTTAQPSPRAPIGANEPAPPATGSSWLDGAVKVAVCGAVAVGGVAVAKRLVAWEKRTRKMTAKEASLKERSYMVGFGLMGCTIGVGVASKVLNGMSESARTANNDAWQRAQVSTGPVNWSAPDARGTTELADVRVSEDGKRCGIRRDVIRSNQGEETAQIPVCKAPGERDYTPTVSLG